MRQAHPAQRQILSGMRKAPGVVPPPAMSGIEWVVEAYGCSSQRLRRASVGFDNPFDSAHGRRWHYTWGFPHSGQNLALRGMGLPHSLQNLVSTAGAPAAAGAAPAAGAEVDFLTASIMAWPMATPAPRPAPTPTAPPPSLAAAMGMACAT